MNRISVAIGLALVSGIMLLPTQAQEDRGEGIEVPESSLEGPTDLGKRAHTNHKILAAASTGQLGLAGKSPAQIRSFYALPSSSPTVKYGTIAIVDAYDYPTAMNDFNVFSKQFGLPLATSTNGVLQVIYQGGTKPAYNKGWAQEAALDIEWAHAMSPDAKIVLVEAQSNSYSDLFAAVDLAVGTGAFEISMSWGGSEFSGETTLDSSHFTTPTQTVFFAASGDTGGRTIYPSASPFVVAVGGTSVATDSRGAFLGETGWSSGGGGPSLYEPKPTWQGGVLNTGSTRSIPDLASDADPSTGVWVYAPGRHGSSWQIFGGTSVSTPCIAGMVNLGGLTYSSTTSFLQAIYSSASAGSFRDITSGNNGYPCLTGWDFVTGLGSPQGTGF